MTVLNLSTKNNLLHHAYCILGNTEDVINELEKLFLKEFKFSTTNNPDFWYGKFDVMDIEDGRSIKTLHQNRPTAGDKKIFVVSANFITEKAQNAMLKLFEEPRGDTHFFLVIPSLNNIIPTFRSRLFIVDTNLPTGQAGESGSSLINPKEFLKMSVGERMEAVKKICGSISDEEKSKIEIIKFINSLETELKNNIDFLKIKKEESKIFEDIETIRQYASEQSPSLKMLLEHVSLILPVLK
jgi:DNA polymerase III delta prime subunit